MFSKNKAFWVTVCILGLLAGMFRIAPPSSMRVRDEKSEFFRTFPMRLGGWTGRDTPPDEKDLEILETRNVLAREYKDSQGAVVNLLLVSSHHDRRVAHPPEVCYVGSNFNILDKSESSIKVGGTEVPFKEFKAVWERDRNEFQYVLYLYKVGERLTTNYYAQQFQFALDRIRRKDSEILLIRISGRSKSSLRDFLTTLIPLIHGVRPRQ